MALLACPAALAAFPGRDGVLAVEPLSGPGIELVQADGTGGHLVCTDTVLCGRPVHPRFSPSGRAIVFEDARSTHIAIVAPDGTCLWCLLGRPLTTGFGDDPAFASDDAVTFTQETATSLSQASLTGGRTRRIAAAPATAAATSSRGEVAVVRGRWIDVRGARAGAFTRLIAGSAPAWSPRGTYLAFVRRGWIWTLRMSDGHVHRLARGASPAWSPSGDRIAFIGPSGAVTTITAGGRHRRPAGSIRGRSVDWQPLPTGPAPCSTGNGAVVAQDGQSVVRQAVGAPNTTIGWNGCLRTVGVHQHLTGGRHSEGCYDSFDLTTIAIAGRFSAMGFDGCDHDGPVCSDPLMVFDQGSGATAVSGPSLGDDCVNTIDSVGVDTSGFAAWHVTTIPGTVSPAVSALSCASTTLCVAVDNAGNAVESGDPEGGSAAWTTVPLDHGPLNGIACPTTTFCVATPDTGGGLLTTGDPLGGTSAWTFSDVDPGQAFSGVSCPSAGFCAVVDGAGNVVTSTAPGAGAAAWTVTPILSAAPPNGLSGISCPSTSECVAIDNDGDVITSTDPLASPSTWTSARVEPARLNSISCPTSTFCAAQATGHIVTSTSPTGGSAAWSDAAVPNAFGPIDCPSASLCVLPGHELLTSTDPAGGASTWTESTRDAGGVDAVSCPSDAFCVLAGNLDGARVYASDAPAAGFASYSSAAVDQPACQLAGTPCDAESLYVHDDAGTRVVDSAPAGTGQVIAGLTLSGNSTTLTWTHDGQPRSLQLH